MPTRYTKHIIVSAIIITKLLFMASLHAEVVATNLVINAGFEEDAVGSIPKEWEVWKKDGKGACLVDDSVGYKSSRSVKVTGASNLALQYTIDVLPGEKYLAKAFCRQKGQGTPELVIYWKDAKHQWNWPAGITKVDYKPFDGRWRKASARVQVPAEGVAQMTVILGANGQNSEEDKVWFDKVSVEKISEKESNLSQNKIKHYILPLPALPIESGDHSNNLSQKETLNALRMGVFTYSNIKQEEAEKKIKQMRDKGYNAILTEGQRYLFVDAANHPPLSDIQIGSLPYPDLVRHTKIVVEVCHKYGLKVYLHLTANSVADYFAADHPDWMGVSLKDGKQANKIWGILFACLNNDNFAKAYFQRLDNLIKETAPDGLMVDETCTMYDTCGCSWCRNKFKKDTGLDLPATGVPWLDDLDSPVYRAFLAWRIQNMKQVNRKIREILSAHIHDGVMLSYYAVPYHAKAWADHGASIDAAGDVADTLGWEVGGWYDKDRLKTWPIFIAIMKLVRAVSENKNGSIFFIDGIGKYPELYYTWLLGLSQGSHQYWPNWGKEKQLVQWEMKYENYLSGLRSSADTAVLISTRNNNLLKTPSGWINRQNTYFAISNTLTLAHIPYKAFVDKDIQTSVLLNKAKTIVMMNVGLISDAEAELIRQFVNRGGTLIASAETSLYKEDGTRRSDFALADLFGCKYKRLVKEGTTLVIKGKHPLLGKFTGEINHPDDYLEVVATGSTEVLGCLKGPDERDLPGLLLNHYGKGKVIYFAGHPETSFYLMEYNMVPTFRDSDDPRDPKMAELFCNLVKNSGPHSVSVDNLPPGVVVETYHHSYKGAQGIQVHLLNLTGMVSNLSSSEPGDVNFPDIKQLLPNPGRPIQIRIRGKDIRNAFMLSPDFDGLYEVPIEKVNDTVICKLPSFARYSIIYFNQGENAVLQKLARIPVHTGQPKIKIIETTSEPQIEVTRKIKSKGVLLSASSAYSEENDASKAYDGIYQPDDSQNCWCCANNQDTNSWWMVDFVSKKTLDKVRVQYRNIGGRFQFVPVSVTVRTSDDGVNWTTVVNKSTKIPKAGSDYDAKLFEYPVGTSARYLRLLFEDGGTAFSGFKTIELVEVEVISKK